MSSSTVQCLEVVHSTSRRSNVRRASSISTAAQAISACIRERKIAQAVDYYIVTPHTETPVALQTYSEYDIALWLEWLTEYLHSAATILDRVVLEDHSIDFDELKAQIKAELYERLYPELYERLSEELRSKLYAEISDELLAKLTDYLNNQLKNELHDLLSGELFEELSGKLYDSLYDSLYKALYVPIEKEEQEEFMPLI